jgi:polar amino acid transport system ATP-binding protein
MKMQSNIVAQQPPDTISKPERALVRIENVWKTRGQNVVLKGINMQAHEGEVICLLGASGAGKSTLLRCINAIEPADTGLIWVDDIAIGCHVGDDYVRRMRESEIAAQRASIGMVFQGFNLFPHMSVLRNITDAPIRVRGLAKAEAEALAMQLLTSVGLADKAKAYPRHLSGGQQQRVAIARALAMKPKLMLFDEPTSALDPHLTHEVLDVMKALAETGMTMIVVTHEIQFARDIGGKVAIMADGQIAEFGPASEVLSNPKTPEARSFLARIIAANN